VASWCFNPRSRARERQRVRGRRAPRAVVSIHAPVRGSDLHRPANDHGPGVSIHAPVRGSDAWRGSTAFNLPGFNPRSRARERPESLGDSNLLKHVSIHAPVRGSDMARQTATREIIGFNPRSRARERPDNNPVNRDKCLFQSTLPCEGATNRRPRGRRYRRVSIHAPVRGSDWSVFLTSRFRTSFNPRSRARERHFPVCKICNNTGFQSTLPCEGATVVALMSM